MRNLILLVAVIGLFVGGILSTRPSATSPTPQQKSPPLRPSSYDVSIPTQYLTYEGVKRQLDDWHRQAPDITEVGVYGKSSQGRDIYYLNICTPQELTFDRINVQLKNGHSKPRVLLTACIHGNEYIANATMMGVIGNYLQKYGRDPEITQLLKERDVYFVPVVSPDSFVSNQRHVDGVDPNRNFPYPGNPNVNSVAPVAALRRFHQDKKFDAAMSGHAFGRVVIYPYGWSKTPCPDAAKYRDIAGRMGKLAGYKPSTISQVETAQPYHGFEADWFYYNNAFALVCEFGTEFKPQSSAIPVEINRAFGAIMLFVKDAPLTTVSPPPLK